jgi:gluconate 5-dehydrogenase
MTGMIPDEVTDTSKLLPADIMAKPVRWLCSPAADAVHDERIVASEFDEWLARRRS